MSDILKIEDLVIQYDTDSGCVHALNGLVLDASRGRNTGSRRRDRRGQNNAGAQHHGIDPVSTGKDCQW